MNEQHNRLFTSKNFNISEVKILIFKNLFDIGFKIVVSSCLVASQNIFYDNLDNQFKYSRSRFMGSHWARQKAITLTGYI